MEEHNWGGIILAFLSGALVALLGFVTTRRKKTNSSTELEFEQKVKLAQLSFEETNKRVEALENRVLEISETLGKYFSRFDEKADLASTWEKKAQTLTSLRHETFVWTQIGHWLAENKADLVKNAMEKIRSDPNLRAMLRNGNQEKLHYAFDMLLEEISLTYISNNDFSVERFKDIFHSRIPEKHMVYGLLKNAFGASIVYLNELIEDNASYLIEEAREELLDTLDAFESEIEVILKL